MLHDVRLRGYRTEDVAFMHALDVACFAEDFRFDVTVMRQYAEAERALVLIAESFEAESAAPKMAGFCIVHLQHGRWGWSGYVVTLDVAPAERRAGVAGRLMDAVERQAAATVRFLELHVHTANVGAIRFYESRGYLRIGLIQGFYGPGLDALLYRRKLYHNPT